MARPSSKYIAAVQEINQHAADQVPLPPSPVQAFRLTKQLVIPVMGQVLTFRAGQAFFEGDPMLKLLRQADAKALIPAEHASVCPKCGTCHATH